MLEREALLEQVFSKLRPFSSAGTRYRLDERLPILLQRLPKITVDAVNVILQWKGCFTKEREFLLRAKDQEPANYLLKIVASLKPLAQRPAVLDLLKCSADELTMSPLMANTEFATGIDPTQLKIAADGLEREMRIHGKLCERWQSCTWCGLTPRCPRRGQLPFGSCSGEIRSLSP